MREWIATRLFIAVVLVGGLVAVVSGQPPRAPTETNGLTAGEAASLWSRDVDTGSITDAANASTATESTALVQLAEATDITFRRPPETAARWTRRDFEDLPKTGPSRSVYPPHAERVNGTYIRDAHATVFAITPSTVVYRSPNQQTRYVAPNGTVRGFIDYRVTLPKSDTTGTETTRYSIASSRVRSVRLITDDGTAVAAAADDPSPEFAYLLEGETASLRLVAEITAEIRIERSREERDWFTLPNGTIVNTTSTATTVEMTSETVTVSDKVAVEAYTPRVALERARTPDGDHLVAAFHAEPWQGLQFGPDGNRRVRGVWRYYTARDPRWDTLVASSDRERTASISPARPVSVYAYPSRLGPRSDSAGQRPTLLDVWGSERSTPATRLPETVAVDVVETAYTASYGVLVETNASDADSVSATGVVRGVDVPIEQNGGVTQLRDSEVRASVVEQSDAAATIRVSLRDAQTGEAIVLGEPNAPFPEPPGGVRTGYIEIDGERVQTNATGVATITINEPGVYTARYVPGSWLGHEPAYAGSRTTVRWHPLFTIAGWLDLLVRTIQVALPFAVAVYAGRRLGRMVGVGGFRP
ncbi:hypothetical protein [Halobaculum lipolyticum]|uniref:Carboxypeptidase regulatory-like domain-containing protein n=1 Tax=Halobaculum lipolyticum TaxID=3032001 RepID=A0ABD5WEV4_9EURY|nr:hypothetical protein [Halobaculum sp. DT31]